MKDKKHKHDRNDDKNKIKIKKRLNSEDKYDKKEY